jgi:riboflavin synthase
MFTGLVESVGTVEAIRRSGAVTVFAVRAHFASELARGESVAVNGTCLTVVRTSSRSFEVEAIGQTVGRTTLGTLTPGSRVNLERAVVAGERLGGHVVTGHVDGVGTVTSVTKTDRGVLVSVDLPSDLTRYVVARGSVAIDGVSLTVASIEAKVLTVALIPETLGATVASSYRRGTSVNIETDILAKHQEKLAAAGPREGDEAASREDGVTLDRLRDLGFLK